MFLPRLSFELQGNLENNGPLFGDTLTLVISLVVCWCWVHSVRTLLAFVRHVVMKTPFAHHADEEDKAATEGARGEHKCRWTDVRLFQIKGGQDVCCRVRCRHCPKNGTAETRFQVRKGAINSGLEEQGSW